MNSASKYAVVALLTLPLLGCAGKKVQAVSAPQAQAPTIASGQTGAMYPPPLTQEAAPEQPAPPPPPTVAQTTPAPEPEPAPEEESKKTPVHKPKPSAAKPGGANSGPDGSAASQPGTPVADSPQLAASGEPAANSPIGQLSTGDTAGRTQTRKETVDLITSTENGLSGIKRPLNADEQETANRIKTFLTKAKQALTNADLDGAYTLATKAKVLLDELLKT